MPKKDTESTESFEIVLRKADQLFNGPPSSRSDLERIYRTSPSRKMPLRNREQIEAPLQQGVSYLHVQARALGSVSNVLERLEALLDSAVPTTRRRRVSNPYS